mmetsp:Transcript_2521/g.6303  ORF Transcript_2521/g.6303 Transcript_2521/m.6303 type:complete len:211 (+) Transcript_2521:902-1534(+)
MQQPRLVFQWWLPQGMQGPMRAITNQRSSRVPSLWPRRAKTTSSPSHTAITALAWTSSRPARACRRRGSAQTSIRRRCLEPRWLVLSCRGQPRCCSARTRLTPLTSLWLRSGRWRRRTRSVASSARTRRTSLHSSARGRSGTKPSTTTSNNASRAKQSCRCWVAAPRPLHKSGSVTPYCRRWHRASSATRRCWASSTRSPEGRARRGIAT